MQTMQGDGGIASLASLLPESSAHGQSKGSLLTCARTHFELGFSVNASITLGRMAMEQQGEKVSATELFNNLFTHLQNAAVTGCKRGKKVGLGDQVAWRTTMKTKKRRSRVTAWKQFQSQVQECASTFPSG